MSYPRAILHIDGDSFFASCEVSLNPYLKGKPVVTGLERGIASAMTYEAKARGVTRGMPLWEIRKVCPEVIILPSDYETYSIFSERMYAIVRRYTELLDEYSIDECFADLGAKKTDLSFELTAAAIKRDLKKELGITFSVGLSVNKVLAKIASKCQKPDGLTFIPKERILEFLYTLPVGKIWGVGPSTAVFLEKRGVFTALDLAGKDHSWVLSHLSKPIIEIWSELRGNFVKELTLVHDSFQKSIHKTRTFTPPSNDPHFILSQLAKNTENACIKARRHNLFARRAYFFLKTKDFRYRGKEFTLPIALNTPYLLLVELQKHFKEVFRKGELYRSSGVILSHMCDSAHRESDLFSVDAKEESHREVYRAVDRLAQRFGKYTVFLGGSLTSLLEGEHKGVRKEKGRRTTILFKGESKRRRLAIPFMGEVY